MKLSEIKSFDKQPVTESVTPIHIIMILQEIIRAKKATNAVHFNVLQQLVQLFKFGHNHSPRYLNEFPSSKQQLDDLKALKDDQQVLLAHWFLEQLVNEEDKENYKQYCNPEQDLAAWVNYVNKKQD